MDITVGPLVNLWGFGAGRAGVPVDVPTPDAIALAKARVGYRQLDVRLNPPALKKLVSLGTQLRPFPPAVMDACLKASLEFYAEESAKNPDFKKIWESLLDFRNTGYEWWQVAEFNYDNYMIRRATRSS